MGAGIWVTNESWLVWELLVLDYAWNSQDGVGGCGLGPSPRGPGTVTMP